jgi:hypothetical protein
MPRVYLSGGMEYAAGEGRDWRREMQSWLEARLACSVFNPNDESERLLKEGHPGVDFRALKSQDLDAYARIAAEFVDADCREIADRSDYVVCYWDESAQRGAGTKGELTIARRSRKPVFMVTAMPPASLPGWILGCTTKIFPSFDDLKSFLSSAG